MNSINFVVSRKILGITPAIWMYLSPVIFVATLWLGDQNIHIERGEIAISVRYLITPLAFTILYLCVDVLCFTRKNYSYGIVVAVFLMAMISVSFHAIMNVVNYMIHPTGYILFGW